MSRSPLPDPPLQSPVKRSQQNPPILVGSSSASTSDEEDAARAVRGKDRPREDTKLATDRGPQPKDSDRERFAWADLSARFAGRERYSGIAILVSPDHPDFPPP